MLRIICGWYALIISILSLLLVIAKDGTSTTNYTGGYKITHLLLHVPIYYFIITSLFG